MSFGLYLHTPFCAVKCGYCDFYSLPPEQPAEVGRVGAALLAATARLLEQPPWRGRPLHSVYVGGGTPSLLPAAFFRGLLGAGPVRERLLPGAEITVEMNPESVRRPWLDGLARLGVSRASLGVQSFQPTLLRFLDRAHTPGQAARVRAAVRAAGIPACGLDLIYQLPGQTEAELARELESLLALEPEHVSAYGLGWEPGTRLEARRRMGETAPLEPERAARLYLRLSRTLRRAGYGHYEVSNFARPGQAARHNSSYWWEGDVLAVGPSAVSAWTEAGRRRRRRFPADWRTFARAVEEGRPPDWPEEPLSGEEAWLEALYVGLRWRGGLDLGRLEARFGSRRVEGLRERVRRLGGPRLESARGRDRALGGLFAPGTPGRPPRATGEILRLRPEEWLLLDEWLVRLVE
ncbi:MAG: coproporphyrinogen-III oxidase family protein [Candidatus Delongbacteria bacterium]